MALAHQRQPSLVIRDKAVPDGVILPVSATITSSIDFRARYDRTLEVFSRPFMQRYAASYRQRAQEQLKEVLEMPDQDANRIIRSLKDNGWQVSGKLKQAYPQLEDAQRAERVVEAVRSAFKARDVGTGEA